jgi:hypothetical protein
MTRFASAAAKRGVETVTPVVGDTTVYGQYFPVTKWWQPFIKNKKNKIDTAANEKSFLTNLP